MKAQRLSETHLTRYGFTYPENPIKDEKALETGERVTACKIEVERVASVDMRSRRYRILQVKTPRERLEISVSPTGMITVQQFKVLKSGKKKTKIRSHSH